MEEEVQACERMAAVSTTSVGVKKSVNKDYPIAATLMAGGSGKGPTYSYCQQAHSSYSCRTVTQPEARKTILQKSGRCFVCLCRGHVSRECNSRLKCYRCNGCHHVSICYKNQDMPRSNEPRSASSSEITRSLTTQEHLTSHLGLNPNALAYDSTTPAATLWVNSGQTVLLKLRC